MSSATSSLKAFLEHAFGPNFRVDLSQLPDKDAYRFYFGLTTELSRIEVERWHKLPEKLARLISEAIWATPVFDLMLKDKHEELLQELEKLRAERNALQEENENYAMEVLELTRFKGYVELTKEMREPQG